MYDFDNLKHGLIAAAAAIVFTATTVAAAVGPARLAETTPVHSVAVAAIVNGSAHG